MIYEGERIQAEIVAAALQADGLQRFSQRTDTFADAAAIHFQLRLTGAARADAAAQP